MPNSTNAPSAHLVRLADFPQHRHAPSLQTLRWIVNSANPNGRRHPLRPCLLKLGHRWYVDLHALDRLIDEQRFLEVMESTPPVGGAA